MTKLFRERDNYPVVPCEDRHKTNHKQWSLDLLAFNTTLTTASYTNIRKRWNLTLDHRVISSLAIVSRYHALPPYILNLLPYHGRNDVVNMLMVKKLCMGNKDTLLKIVKEGIESKEICQIKNPPRYRGVCFTAGYEMMKAFEDRGDDVVKRQKVKSNN